MQSAKKMIITKNEKSLIEWSMFKLLDQRSLESYSSLIISSKQSEIKC